MVGLFGFRELGKRQEVIDSLFEALDGKNIGLAAQFADKSIQFLGSATDGNHHHKRLLAQLLSYFHTQMRIFVGNTFYPFEATKLNQQLKAL